MPVRFTAVCSFSKAGSVHEVELRSLVIRDYSGKLAEIPNTNPSDIIMAGS